MKETEKINIRGLSFDNVTLDEAVARVRTHIKDGTYPLSVFTPNAEIAQMCIEDERVMRLFSSADMLLPDGAGVLLAAEILGSPLKGKIAGVDFGEALMAEGVCCGWRFYFLGGRPGVAMEAALKMTERFPGLAVCGFHDGYFEKEGAENDRVVESIRNAEPHILFVCFGAPAQEMWIAENKDKIPSLKVCLALGGSLDVYAGRVKRAPEIFIKLRLEWFYRLLSEPSRIGRMRRIPRYVAGTLRERLHARRKK
ncbi:MAG: WecB/TagA/CpsF family glycosyltransferase [Clostridiales bacterium]|nr:WecB/TagA/CpsF family glycosyltransferase [Clostridiales bacterium]